MLETVVLDHHFARDTRYPKLLNKFKEKGVPAMSAAEFMGKEE